MFCLSTFTDSFPIEPSDFNKDYAKHLKTIIQDRYVDRVVPSVGLVIVFYDFIDIKEAKILAGDGRAHFKVVFRMVVFQPHPGEILQGVVSGSDSVGLTVSLEFFHDVRIPSVSLREPKGFESAERVWFWSFEGHRLYYALHAPIRFRVQDIRFNKVSKTVVATPYVSTPSKEPAMVIVVCHAAVLVAHCCRNLHIGKLSIVLPIFTRFIFVFSAVRFQGTVNEDGLGLRSWWE